MNWAVLYDSYSYAVEMAYGTVKDYVEYSVKCLSIENTDDEFYRKNNIIYVGSCKEFPALQGGYRLKSLTTEWGTQVVILTGCDEINTVYAAVDFREKFLPLVLNAHKHNGPYFFNKPFIDTMPDYDRSFTPAVENRALWTWGYVIYDYRRYIDNMVKLKLNMLVIWNDFPPENAKEIVAYAHRRGVKIIWGFAWGWGTDCSKIDLSNLEEISRKAIKNYTENYAHLGGDGLYFQSFTELTGERIGNVLIAEAVTDFVNSTACKLLDLYPDLDLQFGLHATSVKDKLEYIAKVDRRITVFWEDCGAFPYDYIPKNVENFEETLRFTESIKALREGGFGALFKGMTCLDWTTFKHQPDTFVLGTHSEEFIKNRTKEKERLWKYLQSYWISNARYPYELIKLFNREDTVGGLVEDGMLESGLWYPVALFAEMFWDKESSIEEILSRVALMPDVRFA